MQSEIKGVVCVHYDEDGNISFHVFGDGGVRLFIVDERAPHDRVYEVRSRADPAAFRKMVPESSEIGHSGDERHAAIAHRLLSDGGHLKLVEEAPHAE